MKYHILSILVVLSFVQGISAEQCGRQAGGALCPGGLCCSEHGRCGSTNAYCGANCQSQCGTGTTPSPPSTPTPTPSGGGSGDVGSIISQALFDQLLKHRNDGVCEANGFYPYDAFITAAGSFNGFGTTGDVLTLVRRNLQRFWLKPLMKLEEGGQSQQMAHMHGDIAFSEKEIEEFIVMIRLRHSTNGPASPVDNTTAEDPSNSPTTTTMGQRVGPLNGSVKQPGYGSY